MDCAAVASHLVAYHFGAVDDPERDAVDAHLLGCTACLKTYLALKRATEKNGSADAGAKPSAAAKARLRAEVAREFGEKKKAVPTENVRLFARRIPLYQGLVAAAIAAAITLAAPAVIRRFSHPDVGAGAPEVDSSRSRAASLQIY
jgi:hypothetical protein